jgi:general stress protein CsbA
MPEYNSGSGTYFTGKYWVIVILFVRVTWSYYYPEVLGISLLDFEANTFKMVPL